MTASDRVTELARVRLEEGVTLRLERRGRDVVVVSDTHLGPPPPYGFPPELEPALAGVIHEAAAAGRIIVLDGDVIDGGLERSVAGDVLRRYPRVAAAIEDACDHTDVVYVAGNHDPPLSQIRRAGAWQACTRLLVGDSVLVTHGHEFDVGLEGTSVGRMEEAFARLQRLLGSRVDLPLAVHDGWRGRLLATAALDLAGRVDRAVDDDGVRAWLDENMNYLLSMETLNDPRYVLATIERTELPPGVRFVICGHTHHPGVARVGAITYANAGTWSKQLATAVTLRGDEVVVRDVVSGRLFGEAAYEDWRRPNDWRAWAEGTDAVRLGPVVRRAVDRVAGGLGALRPRGGPSIVAEAPPGIIPRRAASRAPAVEPPAEGNPLTVRFVEKLTGTLRTLAEPERDRRVTIDLRAAWRPPFRDLAAELTGELTIEALATGRPLRGTLALSGKGGGILGYAIAFDDDGGRSHRLEGDKVLRLADLGASLTELRASLLGPDGELVGEAELVFDAKRELGALVRSITVEGPRQREVARGVAGTSVASHGEIEPVPAGESRLVAVTGATGHLGYNLVGQLLLRGHRVRALVRNARDDARLAPLRALAATAGEGSLTLVEADTTAPASLRLALRGGVDAVIHVASVFQLVGGDEHREIVEPNVAGATHVLRAAQAAGIRRVLLTSSIATLGTDASGREPLDERDWNRDAKNAYHRSKTLAERRAWDFVQGTGLELVVLNPASFIGPNFFRHTPSTRMVADLVAGRLPVVPPFALTWVDVRDVAWAHVLALESAGASGRYVVASSHLSIQELLERMIEVDPDVPMPARRVPAAFASWMTAVDWARSRVQGTPRTLSPSLAADIAGKEIRVSSARIRSELGWAPTDLGRTLADTIAWIRMHYEGR